MDVSDRRMQVQLTQEAKIASDFLYIRAIFAVVGFVSALRPPPGRGDGLFYAMGLPRFSGAHIFPALLQPLRAEERGHLARLRLVRSLQRLRKRFGAEAAAEQAGAEDVYKRQTPDSRACGSLRFSRPLV